MCIACNALFRYNLKDVALLSILCHSKKKLSNGWMFKPELQPFSVQSLQEGVLEFEIFTTNTRMLRVHEQDYQLVYCATVARGNPLSP